MDSSIYTEVPDYVVKYLTLHRLYSEACERISRGQQENSDLKRAIDNLVSDHKTSVKNLHTEIERLKSTRSDLRERCRELTDRNQALEDKVQTLKSENAILESDRRVHRTTIRHLERRALSRDRKPCNAHRKPRDVHRKRTGRGAAARRREKWKDPARRDARNRSQSPISRQNRSRSPAIATVTPDAVAATTAAEPPSYCQDPCPPLEPGEILIA